MMGERDCTLLWTICLVLAAMTGLTDAGWERVCSFDDVSDNQGVCGNQLARLLSLVCGVRGYAGVEKRTDIVAAKKRYSEGKFFLSKQTAHEFLSKRNQGWQTQGKFFRGISCECCHYRCDLPELTQYCAESAYEKKRTVLKPLHRKRSTGSDLTLADLTDKGKVAMVEPTTLVGAAQKTYRHIPREKFTPSKQEPHPRHILSS